MLLEDKHQKDGSPKSLKNADQRKRDEVAHLTKVFGKIGREDAKIVLELIIKLFTDLYKAGILDDVFSEIVEGL